MIPDIGHLEEAAIQTCVSEGFLEKGFVGPGRAGGHHHPIQAVFLDLFGDGFLGVLGAAIKIGVCIDNIIHVVSILGELLHIHHPADIGPAGADKDPDARLLLYLHLSRIGLHLYPDPPYILQGCGSKGRRTAGIRDTLRYILGTLKGPGHKNAWPRGLERRKDACPAKIIMIQIDVHCLCQGSGIAG